MGFVLQFLSFQVGIKLISVCIPSDFKPVIYFLTVYSNASSFFLLSLFPPL